MNQSFSFQRWSLLVGKHWSENKKRYLLSFAALIGLLTIWFVFMMSVNQPLNNAMQFGTYFVALFGTGVFYASQFFRDLGSRSKGINYLLTPASTLEKLVCSLLYTVFCFFILFTAAFYLVDVIMVALSHTMDTSREYGNNVPYKAQVLNLFDFKRQSPPIYELFLLFFGVQSAFLLGSVYFSQYSFIKTAIAVFLLFLFIVFFEDKIMHIFFPGSFYRGLSSYRIYVDGDNDKIVSLPAWINTVVMGLLHYSIPPLLWLVTYFRLKEKEL